MSAGPLHLCLSLISAAAISALSFTPVSAAQDESAAPDRRECVILLHGLTRSPASMRKLEEALTDDGYSVVNQGYRSRSASIEVLAGPTISGAVDQCPDSEMPINFVTHSLGGILLRQYLAAHDLPRLRRSVMLGPPNQGSEVPDKIGGLPGYEWLNGPAGHQLGTDERSVPVSLGAADFDVGIVAGNRTINLFLSGLIPDADDGKVSVERTKLAGMNDHITLPVTHPFLMKNDKAIAQIRHYLHHGEFNHETAKP